MNNYLLTEYQLQTIMNSLLECASKHVLQSIDLIRSLRPHVESKPEESTPKAE
jgi:hypothetical protein